MIRPSEPARKTEPVARSVSRKAWEERRRRPRNPGRRQLRRIITATIQQIRLPFRQHLLHHACLLDGIARSKKITRGRGTLIPRANYRLSYRYFIKLPRKLAASPTHNLLQALTFKQTHHFESC